MRFKDRWRKDLKYLLQEEFLAVRKEFFPRWDRKQEWKVKLNYNCKISGYIANCNRESKTIFLSVGDSPPPFMSKPGNYRKLVIRCLLVHEICHDLTPAGHGKRFQQRMSATAKRAEELGNVEMAERLQAEIQSELPLAEQQER
jgi:hypothetical protein